LRAGGGGPPEKFPVPTGDLLYLGRVQRGGKEKKDAEARLKGRKS